MSSSDVSRPGSPLWAPNSDFMHSVGFLLFSISWASWTYCSMLAWSFLQILLESSSSNSVPASSVSGPRADVFFDEALLIIPCCLVLSESFWLCPQIYSASTSPHSPPFMLLLRFSPHLVSLGWVHLAPNSPLFPYCLFYTQKLKHPTRILIPSLHWWASLPPS